MRAQCTHGMRQKSNPINRRDVRTLDNVATEAATNTEGVGGAEKGGSGIGYGEREKMQS